MRRLCELLPAIGPFERTGPPDQPVAKIEFWLGETGPDDVFAAITGAPIDGHDRIDAAIAAGARTILCERLSGSIADGITYLKVPDSIAAMGRLAHAFHAFPTRRLRVTGVTGTNGKTSTAALLHRLFRGLDRRAGLLSNIGDWINDLATSPRYTTGHALFLSAMMARMVEAGCGDCFMEVSSQSVVENRIEGVDFAGAIFTNLTPDHLHYHGSMTGYAAAKKAWFDRLPVGAFALTNVDDPRGAWMLSDSPANRLSYGTAESADYRLRIVAEELTGLRFEVNARPIRSRLLGAFNAYNLTACYAAACELGSDGGEAAEAIAALAPVEGRMEATSAPDGRIAVVDYAHTPDAVDKVLAHLRAARAPGARIITVIGCGGGGDPTGRPAIAAAAARGSDALILTSDNARNEEPETIASDMLEGLDREMRRRTMTILDRREAIASACAEARPGDLVLIAGKGHERHQDIGGVSLPFSDTDEVRRALGLSKSGGAE